MWDCWNSTSCIPEFIPALLPSTCPPTGQDPRGEQPSSRATLTHLPSSSAGDIPNLRNWGQSTLRASTGVQDLLGTYTKSIPWLVTVGTGSDRAQKLEGLSLRDRMENDALEGGERWEPNNPLMAQLLQPAQRMEQPLSLLPGSPPMQSSCISHES